MNGVLTVKKAAELWGKDRSTIQKAIDRGEFKVTEVERQGGTWLLKESGMRRVYGKLPEIKRGGNE